MFVKLYLKRNFRKNTAKYICVFIIMTLSIILINIPGVLLDAVNHGTAVQKTAVTGGYDIHLLNAEEGDLAWLSGNSGFTAVYRDGEILVSPAKGTSVEQAASMISKIRAEHDLEYEIRSYGYSDNAPFEFIIMIYAVRIFFALMGMYSLYHAYSLLLRTRSDELGILRRLGIGKEDFRRLLLSELFVLFVPAYMLALVLSNGIVLFITEKFFILSQYVISAVYVFSPGTAVVLLILSALAVLGAFLLVCRKTVFGEGEEKNPGYYRRYMFCRLTEGDSGEKTVSAVSVLAKTSLFRSTAYVFPCIVITLFCLSSVLVMFNYMNVANISVDTNDVYIDVLRNTYDEAFERELQSKINALKVDSRFNHLLFETGNKDFVSAFPDEEEKYRTYSRTADGQEYNHVVLRPMEGLSAPEELTGYLAEGTGMAVVSDEGTLGLYRMENVRYQQGKAEPDFVINIAGYAEVGAAGDFQKTGDCLNLFVDEAAYTEITGHPPMVDYIRLGIDEGADYGETVADVRAMFGDSAFEVVDNNRMYAEQRQNTRALFIILLILCVLLAAIGMVLVWVYLSFYAIHREGEVRQLIRLGADRRTILLSDIRAGLWRAVPGYAGGMVMVFLLAAGLLYVGSYTLYINAGAVLLYAVLFVLTAAVFTLPVLLRDRKIIGELQNIMEVKEDAGT